MSFLQFLLIILLIFIFIFHPFIHCTLLAALVALSHRPVPTKENNNTQQAKHNTKTTSVIMKFTLAAITAMLGAAQGTFSIL